MPTTLSDLINAIPVAEDGHVISAHYHNSIRETLLRFATDVGSAPGSQIETITYVPQFLQNGDGPNWKVMNGLATPREVETGAISDGYFAVQLPHGALIQTVTITGRSRAGLVPSFVVKFVRVNAISGDLDILISFPLQNASDPFRETKTINTEEFRHVDGEAFTYLFRAQAERGAGIVQINSVAISYVRS